MHGLQDLHGSSYLHKVLDQCPDYLKEERSNEDVIKGQHFLVDLTDLNLQ